MTVVFVFQKQKLSITSFLYSATTAVSEKCAKGRLDWFLVTKFTNAEEYVAYIKQEFFSVHKTVTTKKVINRYMDRNAVRGQNQQA